MARDRYASYHRTFFGDTYDACARCGGKCEKHKISTLMPGEKESMARVLRMPVRKLEARYLDRLDTPYGSVDILKAKDGCNFLDARSNCTARAAKPVMCDSYPVIFSIVRNRVTFRIDPVGCPMVRWKKYAHLVSDFKGNAIPALRRLRVPLAWWRIVALFDALDFDYVAIERELRHGPGYETFTLEEILGYACNGYEARARRLGLRLLKRRLRAAHASARERLLGAKLPGTTTTRKLRQAYRARLRDDLAVALEVVDEYGKARNILSDPRATAYKECAARTRTRIERLTEDAGSYIRRLRDAARTWPAPPARPVPSPPVEQVARAFCVGPLKRPRGLAAFEVLDGKGRDAMEGYVLLARTFGMDEIDGPEVTRHLLEEGRRRKGIVEMTGAIGEKHRIWHRWVMMVVRDKRGRILAAADGAVVATKSANVYYASHIATRSDLRSKGIGTWLSALKLQAANDHLPEAEAALATTFPGEPGAPPTKLMGEVAEIEFPDPSPGGASSIRRLAFHARQGRRVLWPCRYGQPDTNYVEERFDPEKWNSVPMFISYRGLMKGCRDSRHAVMGVELLYDSFAAGGRPGPEWDRAHLRKGLKRDGRCALVPLPRGDAQLRPFVRKTGWLLDLLARYYPEHRYTRERVKAK